MTKFKGHESILIADVDCTAEGKTLCGTIGVQGYPTLKHGDPGSLEKYEGGRTYEDLEKFALTLKPGCSPSNIDLCDDEQKEEIATIQALSKEELAAAIKEGEDAIAEAESTFKTEVDQLQATYKKLTDDKDAAIALVKDGGLSLKKSVKAARDKDAKAERKAKRAAAKAARLAKKKAKKEEL